MKRISPLLAFVLLTGCGGVPNSSVIHFGTNQSEDITSQFIRVIARPPVEGMDPVALVKGFLEACGDSGNDYQIAREYMTGGMASKWNPNSGAQVYDGATLTLTPGNDGIELQARLDATISPLGHMTLTSVPSNINATFSLNQNEFGQWRITSAPDGLLLSRSDVERSYRSLPVFFSDPEGTHLVPDSIVVPITSAGTATSVVRSLLSGPSPELSNAVKTNFPAGTRLTYGSVPIDVGVANVDLTQEVLAADESMRKLLVAQLVWTLVQLPNVGAVRVSVSGQPLDVPGGAISHKLKDWQMYAPTIVSRDAVLHVLTPDAIQIASQSDKKVEASLAPNVIGSLMSASQDPSSPHFAALLDDGQTVVADLETIGLLTPTLTGEAMSKPTWDLKGNFFVADYGTGVVLVQSNGQILSVPIDVSTFGDASQIKQVVIAPDGIRVAIVFSNGVEDILALGALVHSKQAARITGIHKIENQINSIKDVAWASTISLQVLGSDGSGGQKLFTVGLADGRVGATQVPIGAASLAIDPQGISVLGLSDATSNSVVKLSFGQWSSFANGRAPFYAQ